VCLKPLVVGLIVPLVKDKLGDHNKAKNYRGTTLTPAISKLFEFVIFQLTDRKVQSDNSQLGFKKALAAQMILLPLEMLCSIRCFTRY